MKTTIPSIRKAVLRIAGMVLLSVAASAGSAVAETFRHGGSTASIEQSGGASRSEVTRYQDGQKIVTRDGSSTDVTIQRSGDSSTPGYGWWGYSNSGTDWLDPESFEERFSRALPNGRSVDDCSGCTASSAREVFRRQMLKRMRARPLP